MTSAISEQPKTDKALDFLLGGGEMGERIRSYPWESTVLGDPRHWPQNLKTCVRIMLSSRQPIWIGWGKELIKLYNDPYIAIVGGKHPMALGQPASVVWKDIWDEISHMLRQVMEEDAGTYVESQLLIMERNGYAEETYYTFSYTPIPGDEGATAGMICFNTDDTERILSERQMHTLQGLTKNNVEGNSETEIYDQTLATLNKNKLDFPFAFIYQMDASDDYLKLVEHGLFHTETDEKPQPVIDLNGEGLLEEMVNKAIENYEAIIVNEPEKLIAEMPSGLWNIPPKQAIIVPIMQIGQEKPYAVLVVGMNPYRLPDDKYLHFFRLVADHITSSISAARTYREEQKRIQGLIELDRAKTAFFNNISHEFRTPLTLMLGPLEEMLNEQDSTFSEKNKESIQTTHRNAGRLLRLVNTLLDFSRIESGRVEAHYQPVDIAAFTTDLASNFRSLLEKAGLHFIVACEAADEKVYVDKSMWEKIVLNLLSNAFKYTLTGSIEVHLSVSGDRVILSVKDTGVGIPENELPHMFERFHRVKNVTGRSFEGTGIGLSLVYELVKLHHGDILVESILGKGSNFIVSVPRGKNHLPANQIFETGKSVTPELSDIFIEEGATFLNNGPENTDVDPGTGKDFVKKQPKKVLIVDDNADMRNYLAALLQEEYELGTARNGLEAIDKIKANAPDLVLSDVMMPELDGFGLLKFMKESPHLSRIPVILLSARAGEEARIEGYDVGADDYLVKPFTAKELKTRLRTQINLLQKRNYVEKQLKSLFEQAPVAIAILRGPKYIIELANEQMLELWGKKDHEVLNKPTFEGIPESAGQGFEKILYDVYNTGERYVGDEMPVVLIRNGKQETIYVKLVYEPLREEEGSISGIVAIATDITEQVTSRRKVEENEARLKMAIDSARLGTFDWDLDSKVFLSSPRLVEIFGFGNQTDVPQQELIGRYHPDDIHLRHLALEESLEKGSLMFESRLIWPENSIRWVRVDGLVVYDTDHKPYKIIGTAFDITEHKAQSEFLEKKVEERTVELKESIADLARSNNDLEQFAYVASHDLNEPIRMVSNYISLLDRRYRHLIPEEGLEFMNYAVEGTSRMQYLIKDLLQYSRIGNAKVELKPLDCNSVMKIAIQNLRDIIKKNEATILYDTLPEIQGAESQMVQLFQNLIENGIKFKSDKKPVIKIEAVKSDKEWTFSFEDNGIGINSEYYQKIFIIFQRLHTRDKYEGTGIGLSVCKKIVELHGGKIWVESQPDVGSKFFFTIPA